MNLNQIIRHLDDYHITIQDATSLLDLQQSIDAKSVYLQGLQNARKFQLIDQDLSLIPTADLPFLPTLKVHFLFQSNMLPLGLTNNVPLIDFSIGYSTTKISNALTTFVDDYSATLIASYAETLVSLRINFDDTTYYSDSFSITIPSNTSQYESFSKEVETLLTNEKEILKRFPLIAEMQHFGSIVNVLFECSDVNFPDRGRGDVFGKRWYGYWALSRKQQILCHEGDHDQFLIRHFRESVSHPIREEIEDMIFRIQNSITFWKEDFVVELVDKFQQWESDGENWMAPTAEIEEFKQILITEDRLYDIYGKIYTLEGDKLEFDLHQDRFRNERGLFSEEKLKLELRKAIIRSEEKVGFKRRSLDHGQRKRRKLVCAVCDKELCASSWHRHLKTESHFQCLVLKTENNEDSWEFQTL